jgi:hypothetical protein
MDKPGKSPLNTKRAFKQEHTCCAGHCLATPGFGITVHHPLWFRRERFPKSVGNIRWRGVNKKVLNHIDDLQPLNDAFYSITPERDCTFFIASYSPTLITHYDVER